MRITAPRFEDPQVEPIIAIARVLGKARTSDDLARDGEG
jgi:hypothetical protein